MYIEYIETNEKSEVVRRKIAKETVLTKDCTHCGKPSSPSWIGPLRSTTQLVVKWFSSGNEIACSKGCVSSLTNQKTPKESYLKRGKKSSQTQRGRTYEEIYGSEKAAMMKESISTRLSEANPRWSTKYRTSDEIEMQKELNRNAKNNPFSKFVKGKKLEDIYGTEKAESIKAKHSINNKGENNPMFGRTSPLSSGAGRKGYYRGTYFRSSLELLFMHKCWEEGITYETAEKPEYQVEYKLDGVERTYRPDFYLPETDTVVEVKPSHLVRNIENLEKFTAASKKFSNFVIVTEKDLPWIGKERYQELIDTNCIQLLTKNNL